MTAKRAQSRRAGKEPGAVAETGARWPADAVERRPVSALLPYIRNARTHSDEQVAQIAASIREFGWTFPVLVDEAGTIKGPATDEVFLREYFKEYRRLMTTEPNIQIARET